LLEAAQSTSENDHAILRSCAGIFLFGVPNRGLNNENMLSLVKEAKVPFVHNLMENSAILRDLHVNFLRAYEKHFKGCFVASFYETLDTPTVEVGAISAILKKAY
jgi:hypothetical protein